MESASRLSSSSHQVDHALGLAYWKSLLHGKVSTKFRLELLDGIIIEDVLSNDQQALHLGIGLGDEFNNEMSADSMQEFCDMAQRNISGNSQMMHKCQGHYQIGWAAVDQAHAF